ncbi:MAG TPA: PTS sugar transporter subunit IIA [Syntrophaceae bacterium]|nr:PTS sugar transporter subunit IIA [Syntrophaceae bacterium]
MKIVDILDEDFVIPDLSATNKREVLKELIAVFSKKYNKLDRESLLAVLLEREKLGSTGIGEGVAIPHGKIGNLECVLLSFGRSKNGIGFDSIDGKPVHLFFLLVAPENSAGLHLKALAKISRMLRNPSLRKDLMGAESREEILQILTQADKEPEV